MILLDLINFQKLRRVLLYIFCLVAALWLQFAVFSRIALPGTAVGVKPFFVPVMVVAIGLWEGGVWGGVFGLAVGIYCDGNLSGSTVTFLILFTALGFFAGVLADYVINRRFVAYLLLTLMALLLTALFQILPLWIFRGASPADLIPVGIFQTLWSWPFAVPAYFAVRAVARSDGE